ncbi:hypothetical protein FT663_02988 [Candidozyma haemuli var. vulneris]|uniref:Kynurenine 3-monooxygenase n=1 Tax=Candidozyma haemuli TaxID=45357 RepID=A0A2V1ALP3_9ASCO|nr:hypothetical protein CXQ85_001518 [[Candida] haemuloni]KAF3990915.1 hypothetical protein FT663_02988 [[Candida] haemuloni var. vulneris]KAF3992745.1 hypothetical protein FT662_00954 [[Candida] haemuloni var. vulneris]PVH19217.1 hypothetical protein CXQ85_001518 [[Candida] haemuloni]
MTTSVGIVGAGLVGCLTGLALNAKGFDVTIFELRPDPRKENSRASLRSINLAVSDRGIRAMRQIDKDLAERVLQHVIPMKGRMIHDASGKKQESQIYGLFGETINSIDRLFLNKVLLQELSRVRVKVFFEHKLVNMVNGEQPELQLAAKDGIDKKVKFDYVIGADGAHSQFRYQMQKGMRMDINQQYIDMQYLELSIPRVAGAATNHPSRFAIDPNHLHIWPRKDFMLIALPNEDGSFTSTFFSPWSVMESFKHNADSFLAFFKHHFPDAYELIGEKRLSYAFIHQPRCSLMQVSVNPYSSPNHRALIIGDAAHSMVPFYGQGMNCGFEDVHVLMKLLEKNQKNLSRSFAQYTAERKEDLDAICKLALDNYYEMSTKVIDPFYLLRKKIDYVLGKLGRGFPFTWIPMYTMISFRGDIRYSDAVRREKKQAKILRWLQNGSLVIIAILIAFHAKKLRRFLKR